MPKIILATSSPHRREAFRSLGIDFEVEDSNVDESQIERNEPEELVKELSRLKAEAVAKKHSKGIIIGFDSIGWLNGLILEKPKSKEQAFKRLKSLSGKKHQFITGIYMINISTGQTLSKVIKTNVFMRKLKELEIKKYLDQDPDFNTYALGYDPLGHYSSSFVEKIEGSYNNLTRGIPLETIVEMFSVLGYKL